MKVLKTFERSKYFWYLLSLGLLFFLLRFPSLFEPNWYGDEGVYQVVGDAITHGRLLYSGIWDNKPPLLYMIYGFFGSDQFAIRFLSLIVGLLSIFLFYKICKKLFTSQKISFLVTVFFSLFLALPVIEGNIANAENFMIAPTLLSSLILLNLKNDNTKKTQNKNILLVFLSGLTLSVSFLLKIVAIFDFAAFLVFMSIFTDKKFIEHIKNKKYQTYEVKKVFFFIIGFIILPIITILFFFVKGSFSDFLNATFFSNIGYVGYGNKLIIPQGLLLIKLGLLVLLIIFLSLKRSKLKLNSTFVLLWFAFSLFNAFFSQRPYTHYLLVLLPTFSLLLGLTFSEKRFVAINVLILIVSTLLILKNFTFYAKDFSYYGNFLSFVTGSKTVSQYQRFFDNQTPIDYELSIYIKTHTKATDPIFDWGNNAQLYKLTDKLPPGRYAVAYHITGARQGIRETMNDIKTKKPKLILIMLGQNFPFALSNYRQKIILENVLVYERIL